MGQPNNDITITLHFYLQAEGASGRSERKERAEGLSGRSDRKERAEGANERSERKERVEGAIRRNERKERAEGASGRSEQKERAEGPSGRTEQGSSGRTERKERAERPTYSVAATQPNCRKIFPHFSMGSKKCAERSCCRISHLTFPSFSSFLFKFDSTLFHCSCPHQSESSSRFVVYCLLFIPLRFHWILEIV